jgi:hypothetical protein
MPQNVDAVHASSFSLAIDPGTFAIVFTRPVFMLGETGLAGEITLMPSAAVAMSPQLAKNFVQVLGNAVKRYEKEYGRINPISE